MAQLRSIAWWQRLLHVFAANLCLVILCTSSTAERFDPSTDLILTYNKQGFFDSDAFQYHNSFHDYYTNFLLIAIRRGAWPVDKYAQAEDFEPVFSYLNEVHPHTAPKEVDEDDWARPFMSKGDELYSIAMTKVSQNYTEEAISLYMRAAGIFRMGYFPWVQLTTSRSPLKIQAWHKDKLAFREALYLMKDIGLRQHHVALHQKVEHHGFSFCGNIPLYVFHGKHATGPAPVVLIITGLDHYHTYTLAQAELLLSHGYRVVVTPMPGTADSPISARQPQSDKHYWSTIIDWIETKPHLFKTKCISVWGLSTGSYWALKASRLERKRIKQVLSAGTASHYTFTRDWMDIAENLAYPASLQTALGRAFGYYEPETFKADIEQYSLLYQGVLDRDGAPVTGINGERDSTFPIDDQRILLEHGQGAALRWFPHLGHMGEPASEPWLRQFWKAHATC